MYKLSKMQSGFDTYPDVIDGDVAFESVLDTCNPGLNADGDVVADVNTKLGEVPLCAFIWKKCRSTNKRPLWPPACMRVQIVHVLQTPQTSLQRI